jgi:hypothetical protein
METIGLFNYNLGVLGPRNCVGKKQTKNTLRRDYDNLKSSALIFWPTELTTKEKASSIIPKLLETQDKFISFLHIADKTPFAWKQILPSTNHLPANLFLKHLMILSDISGEKLKRFKSELPQILRDRAIHFLWKGKEYSYPFHTFGGKLSWSNKQLFVDGEGLSRPIVINDTLEDVIMLLLHGSASVDVGLPDEIHEKCIVGSLLGDKRGLDLFVRQRYIWVSRITGGATANRMGYLAEDYVREQLQSFMPNWNFSRKSIPGISQNDGRTPIQFDMVAESPSGKYCAIELSFQVTTNSTIERKAGQAQSRQTVLHSNGHRIAYVIDGAGNFERRAAMATICQYSDCTVTFRNSEIQKLAEFLRHL